MLTEWILVIGNRRPSALLKSRAFLVSDSFERHLIPEIKNRTASLNSDLVVIPGDVISHIQVNDVVSKKPFSYHLRKLCSELLLSGNHSHTFWKNREASCGLLCQWILVSWER